MHRYGIVETRLDASLAEPRRQRIAFGEANGKDMVDMPAPFGLQRQIDAGNTGKLLSVILSERPAGLGPVLEISQLDPQDGALDGVHPIVEAFLDMVITLELTPIAQPADPFGSGIAVGGDKATFAAGHADTAGAAPEIFRAMRLASIFDDHEAEAVSEEAQRVHIGHLAIKVYGQDGSRPRHIRAFDVTGNRLSDGRILLQVDSGVPDGFRLDTEGWIWTSAADGVQVFHPSGALMGKIRIPQPVANLEFGGPRRNRLFITATRSLYAIYVNARGALYP
ncbi:MAG: hypothetical protein EOP20_15625 [Hyphomicrobiales bacterium]|nr:MAG: hypothetical protein EOP20_15625 [Hyphomicrobiales bacterium]